MSVESTVHEYDYTRLVEATWRRTGGDSPLSFFGDFQGLYDSIPYKQRLVETVSGAKLYAVCIDERLIGSDVLNPETANYVRMAGEGVLNPNAKEDMKKAGVAGIITHTRCTAKGVFAKGQEGHPDIIGITAVRALARELNIEVVDTIDPHQFRSPIHDARVIFYDATGRFDWSRTPKFPLPGFIVSRGIISDPSYAQKEADMAIGIAQGDHGLGRKFTDRSPLYLVGVTDSLPNSIQTHQIRRELREVADKNQAVGVDLIIAR